MSPFCIEGDESDSLFIVCRNALDHLLEAASLAMLFVAPRSGIRYSACTELSMGNDQHHPYPAGTSTDQQIGAPPCIPS
jgi:hypothetical protein